MCGIFIVLERGREVDEKQALQATQALRHRGPDDSGHCSFAYTPRGTRGSAAVHAFVGHTRLSILDISARSSQPFRRRGRTLVYNGEIYNFRDLRDDLKRRGASFETDGDTEVLLELIATGGIEALREANGMWAFGLLDEVAGIFTAARDCYGKKPLFYYASATTFCMASEIGPIFTYLGRRPELVTADLDKYLRWGWLFPRSDGATHVQGVRQVMAGGVLTFDLAAWTLREQRYFDLADFSRIAGPNSEELAAIVKDAVVARLVADRKVGLLLSGGVDSTLILSVLCAAGLANRVSCFTGDAGKSDDAHYAKQCITQLGITHVNVPLEYGSTSIDSFLRVCRHQEKPFPFIGNALAAPQLYALIAAHDVPVVLDGAGGDEIFAGYWDRYYRFAIAEAIAGGDEDWLAETLAANADNIRIRALADEALHAAKAGGRRGAPQAGIMRMSEDPPDLDSFLQPAVCTASSTDPLEDGAGTLADALITDAAHGRLQEWLWQNDRNAMMSGIENRSPFLDYRLAPYMHSGYRHKFVGAWNKHELRSLFSSFAPLPTQWRRDKQGFRWVYSRFLRHNRDQVLELVASSRILARRVDVARLLDRARSRDDYLGSSLIERMLCIAGLEQTMDIGAAEASALSGE